MEVLYLLISRITIAFMEDVQLLALLYEGDEFAFKRLFVKYYSPLCEYASHYVSDEDAEELVQELMLYIWENREGLVIQRSFKSYMFTAVQHRCLNAVKRGQYVQRIHSLLYEQMKDRFESPDFYMLDELTEKIRQAVDELPEKYKETFVLSRFGEQTNAEIAKALNVSVKTVEYRISQSLKILRVKLKDYLPLLIFLT